MKVKLIALCSLLLHILIPLGAQGHGNMEMNIEIPNKPIRIEKVHSRQSSHMHHIDPSLIVFFLPEDLQHGNTIPVHFPKRKLDSSKSLTKEEADSVPFSSQELKNLLKYFSFSPGSPQATAMENTLRECENKPIAGETKTCATSYESMIDFAKTIFGLKEKVKILSTTHLTESKALLQKYKVMGIKEIEAEKSVACHTMPYAYTVFYCHYQKSKSRIFSVKLLGENEDEVEAIGVCHMDTSHWSRNHVSFKVLGVEPGSSPVCHFFPSDNFVLVPSTNLIVA